MRSAATVALAFDSAKLFYFPTPRIIPENPDVANGFDMSPYTPPCWDHCGSVMGTKKFHDLGTLVRGQRKLPMCH